MFVLVTTAQRFSYTNENHHFSLYVRHACLQVQSRSKSIVLRVVAYKSVFTKAIG